MTTRPPPALDAAPMALRMASVLSVLPSAAAPNLVIGNSRLGITGGLIRERISVAPAQAGLGVLALGCDAMALGSRARRRDDSRYGCPTSFSSSSPARMKGPTPFRSF